MTVEKHYARISKTPCFLGENSQEISTNRENQRAPNVHQQTCTSRWAENSKEWKFFSAACHAPILHVFNVGPKWVFSFAKTVREKNCIFAISLEIAAFQRARKSCRNFLECTFSFDNLLFSFILVRVIAQEALKTLKRPSVVHICWCTLGALLENDYGDRKLQRHSLFSTAGSFGIRNANERARANADKRRFQALWKGTPKRR